MKLNFEGLEMQKWNKPTDRAQKVDKKNEVICLVIIFNSRIMVIKMSKIAFSEINKIFRMQLNILPKLRRIFYSYQQKIQKMSHFWHSNGHNSGSKYDD